MTRTHLFDGPEFFVPVFIEQTLRGRQFKDVLEPPEMYIKVLHFCSGHTKFD